MGLGGISVKVRKPPRFSQIDLISTGGGFPTFTEMTSDKNFRWITVVTHLPGTVACCFQTRFLALKRSNMGILEKLLVSQVGV